MSLSRQSIKPLLGNKWKRRRRRRHRRRRAQVSLFACFLLQQRTEFHLASLTIDGVSTVSHGEFVACYRRPIMNKKRVPKRK